MLPIEVIEQIESNFTGIAPKTSWGETSLFYNPKQKLPNGVYFCTIKEKNGENDKASALDRHGIFRLSIGIPKEHFIKAFGKPPIRPNKGGIINTHHDFTAINELMPHPIYGWMSWLQILNPTQASFDKLLPLLEAAYSKAVIKFDKKVAKLSKI